MARYRYAVLTASPSTHDSWAAARAAARAARRSDWHGWTGGWLKPSSVPGLDLAAAPEGEWRQALPLYKSALHYAGARLQSGTCSIRPDLVVVRGPAPKKAPASKKATGRRKGGRAKLVPPAERSTSKKGTAPKKAPADQIARQIPATLAAYGIRGARVASTTTGPRWRRFLVTVPPGTRGRALRSRSADLARDLGVSAIEARQVRGALALDVPRADPTVVRIGPLLKSPPRRGLPYLVGVDAVGQRVTGDLSKDAHVMLAGSTGSGKTSALRAVLLSLQRWGQPRIEVATAKPEEWADFPLAGPIRPIEELAPAAREAVEAPARGRRRPVVVVVDELETLLASSTARDEVLADLALVARTGRSRRVHLILCTQRPSAAALGGDLLANVPARLVFRLPSEVASRVALNQGGAEGLLGQGDGLFLSGGGTLTRVQAPLVEARDLPRQGRLL